MIRWHSYICRVYNNKVRLLLSFSDVKAPDYFSFKTFLGDIHFAIIIIIIIIIIPFEFFTPVLVDGLSLESEWQRFSSGLQDSSQYSGRS